MKKYPQSELHFDKKCFNDNLGNGNIIFVGSSTDMWAKEVPSEWIFKVLEYCRKYPENTYLFQSKNPKRFADFADMFFPIRSIFGTTIETNKQELIKSKAPPNIERQFWISQRPRKMVSIEPIMDFDVITMVNWMKYINPEFVSIGADSQRHNLPEPSAQKVKLLIEKLSKFTEIKCKDNLKRILKGVKR
jgi:protein gp37